MKWRSACCASTQANKGVPKSFPVSTLDLHTVLSLHLTWQQGEINVPSYVHVIDPAESHMRNTTSTKPQHTYIILKYINFIKDAILALRYITPINSDRYNMFSNSLLFYKKPSIIMIVQLYSHMPYVSLAFETTNAF